MMAAPRPLWTPDPGAIAASQLARFQSHVATTYTLPPFSDYAALHAWSIEHIPEFWSEVWDWPAFDVKVGGGATRVSGVRSSRRWDTVVDMKRPMAEIPRWFDGAKLNWAENMLLPSEKGSGLEDKTALIECTEPAKGEKMVYSRTSFKALREQVHCVQLGLKKLGLKEGQVVGYYGSTCANSVVLLLAVTSLGGIFSSSAADFGPQGVIERFDQFSSSLFAVFGSTTCRYNAKTMDQLAKLGEVVAGLSELKGLVKVACGELDVPEGWMRWEALRALGNDELARRGEVEMEFFQGDFDHPLWVLFSSGTTGKPKPIVHRAGGMLLQSKKEHVLHGNMGPNDVFFYFTTCGWMMYNYLVAGLATGAAIVLYDGSPLYRPSLLWEMTVDLGVTVFGTSAKYLDVLSTSYSPIAHHDLSTLKQVLSTGSPLKASLFEWVYEHIKKDVILGSITGGTDICSLFGAHCTNLPVYAGQIQCLGLGMAVASFSDAGTPVPLGEAGELVCTKTFPCMPLKFWGDVGGRRYWESYFERFAGVLKEAVWAHGDYCVVTEQGGLEMRGRSDGILNPSGIRFGSSEIYEVIDTFLDEGIEDSLVVAQKIQGGADERVVLFLKLRDGTTLKTVEKDVRGRIRTMRSARHVPERILAVEDIPYTINGKKVEVPIKKILAGAPVGSINPATLRNPECLIKYVGLGEVLRAEIKWL